MHLALLGILIMIGVVPERRPVVLLTDCGASIDDQWALTHLALAPEVELRGIITSHVPKIQDSEVTARSAREVLAQLPPSIARPQVVAGSSHPLGDSLNLRTDQAGARFLIEQARDFRPDRRLVVAVIGPATDIGLALKLDPTLEERISVIAMAFDQWPEGGDPWNAKLDVKAWQIVLDSAIPLVIGDDAVCRKSLSLTSKKAHELFDGSESKSAKALVGELDRRLEADRVASFPIWDQVVVAWILNQTVIETHPRPHLKADRFFDHHDPKGELGWVTKVDEPAFWSHLRARFRDQAK